MKSSSLTAVLALTSVLVACGTTSNIKPNAEAQSAGSLPQKGTTRIDLSGYQKVVVLDFVDATDKHNLGAAEARDLSDSMTSAVHTFPDLIAQKLRDTGAFQEVVRGPSSGKALSISGSITRLTEGSSALRFWVGMGAGSSYFDATTDLSDAETGAKLGQVTTDKNSWALGGGIAASQTVQTFMQGAAERIAAQLRDSKNGLSVAKTH